MPLSASRAMSKPPVVRGQADLSSRGISRLDGSDTAREMVKTSGNNNSNACNFSPACERVTPTRLAEDEEKRVSG